MRCGKTLFQFSLKIFKHLLPLRINSISFIQYPTLLVSEAQFFWFSNTKQLLFSFFHFMLYWIHPKIHNSGNLFLHLTSKLKILSNYINCIHHLKVISAYFLKYFNKFHFMFVTIFWLADFFSIFFTALTYCSTNSNKCKKKFADIFYSISLHLV